MSAKGVSQLLAQIIANIYTNTSNNIDGDLLQAQLTDIIDSLNQGLYNNLIPYNAGQTVIIDDGGTKKQYLCITNTTPGESPINTSAKWEFVNAVGVSLSSIELDTTALKAITGYVNEDQVLVNTNNGLYGFSDTSIEAPDDDLVVLPDDITLPDPGRWIKIKTLVDSTTTGSIGDLTSPVITNLVAAINGLAKNGIEIVDNIDGLQAIIAARRDFKAVIVRYYDEEDESAVSGGDVKLLLYKGSDFTDPEWQDVTNWKDLQSSFKTGFTTTATNFQGIPSGTVINVGDLFESVLNSLLRPYIPSSIGSCSVETTPSGLTFEVGASVDIDSITIAVNNDSEGDPPDTLYISGNGYNVPANVGVNAPPTPLTIQKTESINEVWTISGTDANSDPINEVEVSINWLFRYFVGISNTSLTGSSTPAEVKAVLDNLQNKVLRTGKQAQITCNATYNLDGYYTYIAYAASYDVLSEVIMNGGVNVLDAFEEIGDFDYENLEGHTESYKLYKSLSSGAFENGDVLDIS